MPESFKLAFRSLSELATLSAVIQTGVKGGGRMAILPLCHSASYTDCFVFGSSILAFQKEG